ncbi:MAG TPA: TonB family protein [Chthoniobacteraceae bacterium]|nr:TonB family protein [Chthoniobacteraceae bacterium]
MKFVPPRRVVAASAVSVLFHLTLFGLLALFSGGSYSLPTLALEEGTSAEPLVFEIEAPLPEATPEPIPEPTPEPLLAAAEPVTTPAPTLPAAEPPQPLRTALDPEHLKESTQAPENPVFVASHHSRATAPERPEAPAPPSPEAEPGGEAVAAPFQAAPEPAPRAGADDEVGIDAIGDWKKAVGNRIGSRWNDFRESQARLLAVGSVRVRFAIDAKGDVSSLKIVSSSASEANAEYALRAIREADLPPIPPERLARVPGGRIEIEFTFTIFPNR